MTIVAFGAIIDAWNVSVYIQRSWIEILQHLTFEINQQMARRGELLISETAGSVPGYPAPH